MKKTLSWAIILELLSAAFLDVLLIPIFLVGFVIGEAGRTRGPRDPSP